MHLSRLEVGGFRNIESAELELHKQFNYIYGDNGAGKTALLEAVSTLSRGRSFRTLKTTSLIRHQQNEFFLRGLVHHDAGLDHSVGLGRSRRGEMQIRIDGQNSLKTSELARLVPSQVLLPDAAELVFGAPGIRRSFLDWGLFHVEPSYLDLSRKYRRTVQQRNAWLRDAIEGEAFERDPWAGQLVEYGGQLAEDQSRYLRRLMPSFEAIMSALAPELNIRVEYDWGGLESLENAAKKWSESFPRDVKFGLTHRGPHRADLELKQEDDAAAEVLSRGQAKATASALLLAQAKQQIVETDKACILLIDDFGAELDAQHWRRFLEVLADLKCQVIATSTSAPEQNEAWVDQMDCGVFHVKQGVFERMR